MLELRPVCENCGALLPPDSTEAMICSYECTFCAECVEKILDNVCPNCGGGFSRRPIRPSINWKDGNFLANDPPTKTVKLRPVDMADFIALRDTVRGISPEKR